MEVSKCSVFVVFMKEMSFSEPRISVKKRFVCLLPRAKHFRRRTSYLLRVEGISVYADSRKFVIVILQTFSGNGRTWFVFDDFGCVFADPVTNLSNSEKYAPTLCCGAMPSKSPLTWRPFCGLNMVDQVYTRMRSLKSFEIPQRTITYTLQIFSSA